jgi:Spy/CpxP family protein refolding chaperone
MRQLIFVTMLALFVWTALAQAQSPQTTTKEQLQQLQQKLDEIQSFQGKVGVYYEQLQQGGGGRGAAPGGLTIARSPRTVFVWNGGAWWTNANLVSRLGLTDDQKSKIEKAFENRKQNLSDESTQLDKQEAQLAVLLAADPVDHNAVLSQIDHVAQARADLERTNSAMTLEMREVLTAAQWQQLQSQPQWLDGNVGVRLYTPFGVTPNPGGTGQRNGGQRSGQRQQ